MADKLYEAEAARFQKPLKPNALLPYYDRLGPEADGMYAEIKGGLSMSILSREYYRETLYWMDTLKRYIHYYGLRFTKSDHAAFVHVMYHLVTMKDLDTRVLCSAADLFITLMSYNLAFDRDDLVLDWRPLYDMLRFVHGSGKANQGFLRSQADLEEKIKAVITKAKSYFPESSLEEIWLELRPDIFGNIVYDGQSLDGIQMLSIFTPFYVNNFDVIERLWLKEIFEIWKMSFQHNKSDNDLLTLLKNIALYHTGRVDWEPHLDLLFTNLLRSFSLPVGSSGLGGVATQQLLRIATRLGANGQSEMNTVAHLIIYTITSQQSTTPRRLRDLFKAVHSFYHPANHGHWSSHLNELLKSLASCLFQRVFRERKMKPRLPGFGNLPEHVKLTDDQITELVEILLPICMLALFTKETQGSRIADALHCLALLRPALVVPEVLTVFHDSCDSLLEPHRLGNCLQALTQLHLPLMDSGLAYPEGKLQMLPLLRALLPAIDLNDPNKMSQALVCFANIANCMLIEDVSGKARSSGLAEVEQQVALATAQFEDLILLFFDRLLEVLTGASSWSHIQHETSLSVDKNTQEKKIYGHLYTASVCICMVTSRDIREQLLRKLIDFIFGNILDPSIARELRCHVHGILMEDLTEEGIRLFLPRFLTHLNEVVADDHVIYQGEPNQRLMWLLCILPGFISKQIINWSDQLLHIFTTLRPYTNTKLTKALSSTLREVFSVLTKLVPQLNVPDNFLTDFHKLSWSPLVTLSDLIARQLPLWEAPGQAHIALAQRLVDEVLTPILDRLAEYPTKSDTFEQREVQCLCQLVYSSMWGAYSAIPNLPNTDFADLPADVAKYGRLQRGKLSGFIVAAENDESRLHVYGGQCLRTVVLQRAIELLECSAGGLLLDSDTMKMVTAIGREAVTVEGRQSDENNYKMWTTRYTQVLRNKLKKSACSAVGWFIKANLLHIERACLIRHDFTRQVQRFAEALLPFVVSQFKVQRREAVETLKKIGSKQAYLLTYLLPKVIPYLSPDLSEGEVEEHQFQGAVEFVQAVVSHAEITQSLINMRRLYPTIVRAGLSKHCHKPAIRLAQNTVVDNLIINSNTVTLLQFNGPPDLEKMAAQLFTPSESQKEEIETRRTSVVNFLSDRRELYLATITEMIQGFTVTPEAGGRSGNQAAPGIPWEPLNQMLSMMPLTCDLPIPVQLFEFATSLLFHPTPQVSSTAAQLLLAAIWTLRYRRRRIWRDPPTLTAKGHSDVQCAAGTVEPPTLGVRPDNEFLLYDQDANILDSEEAWSKHHHIRFIGTGFKYWPARIRIRDPQDYQFTEKDETEPCAYVSNPTDQANLTFVLRTFLDPVLWQRLEDFLLTVYVNRSTDGGSSSSSMVSSLEDLSDTAFPLSMLISGLLRVVGPKLIPHIVHLVNRLLDENSAKQELAIKWAVKTIGGTVSGSKDWPREQLRVLYTEVLPALIKRYIEVAPQDYLPLLADRLCVTVATCKVDIHTLHPLIDFLEHQMVAWQHEPPKERACYDFLLLYGVLCSWRGGRLIARRMTDWARYAHHENHRTRDSAAVALKTFLAVDFTSIGADPKYAPFDGYHFLESKVVPLIAHHTTVILRSKELEPSRTTLAAVERWKASGEDEDFTETPSTRDASAGPGSDEEEEDTATESEEMEMEQEKQGNGVAGKTGQQEEQSSGGGRSGTGEWMTRIRSMKILKPLFNGISFILVNFSYSYPRAELWEALLVGADLLACRDRDHLESSVDNCFSAFSTALVTPTNFACVMSTLQELAGHASWKTRRVMLRLMQRLVFHNLFVFGGVEGTKQNLKQIILDRLLDDILEVRQEAAVTLAGFVQCGQLEVENSLVTQLSQWSHVGRLLVVRPGSATDTDRLRRHSGVLGLCALVRAYPYDVPDFLPKVVVEVCRHANDPEPIRGTVKETLASFSRTHHETWHVHRDRFTEEQLHALTDVLVSPNYYA